MDTVQEANRKQREKQQHKSRFQKVGKGVTNLQAFAGFGPGAVIPLPREMSAPEMEIMADRTRAAYRGVTIDEIGLVELAAMKADIMSLYP